MRSGSGTLGIPKDNSGNLALSMTRPGFHEVYDRGELLYLCARAVMEQDACPESLCSHFGLTQQEVLDVLSMVD